MHKVENVKIHAMRQYSYMVLATNFQTNQHSMGNVVNNTLTAFYFSGNFWALIPGWINLGVQFNAYIIYEETEVYMKKQLKFSSHNEIIQVTCVHSFKWA